MHSKGANMHQLWEPSTDGHVCILCPPKSQISQMIRTLLSEPRFGVSWLKLVLCCAVQVDKELAKCIELMSEVETAVATKKQHRSVPYREERQHC